MKTLQAFATSSAWAWAGLREHFRSFWPGRFCRLSCAAFLFLAVACGTAWAKKNVPPKYVFYPPAPNAPRLQFLTAFSSERDLRGKDSSLLSYVTGQKPPENPIAKPYGAAIHNKKIYVCDTAFGVVLALDLESRRMRGISPAGPGAFKTPLNLVIDSEGNYYVADSGRDQVVILDANEHFVAALGEKGVNKPRDVAVTKEHIYVGDIEKHCIHVYDRATRTNLFDFPSPEEAADIMKRLFQPTNIALDSQGRIYVGDTGAYRVQVFDSNGKYLRSVGRHGDNLGEFSRLKGVAVDRSNRIYAVDAGTAAVQMFDEEGKLLMWFGAPNESPVSLDLPAKVVVDYDHVDLFQRYAAPGFKLEHLVLVINQLGPRKVSVFGFGQKQ